LAQKEIHRKNEQEKKNLAALRIKAGLDPLKSIYAPPPVSVSSVSAPPAPPGGGPDASLA
jgi:hypothetical protein